MKKLIFLTVVGLLISCSENYSKDEKEGIITEFRKSGLLWDSWDGGIETSTSEIFLFSLDNDKEDKDEKIKKLIESIQKAKKEKSEVTIYYHKVRGWNWFNNRGLTNVFVDSIKIKKSVKPKETQPIQRDTIYVKILEP